MNQWEVEPDEVEFVDPITKKTCYIVRHELFKTLNGYVVVDPDSPALKNPEHFSVHGGVTWHGKLISRYVIGFDTNHAMDLKPNSMFNILNQTHQPHMKYRSLNYVVLECCDLAKQIEKYELTHSTKRR